MGAKHTKVPLSSIKALTLHDGRLTTHRRGKAVRECLGTSSPPPRSLLFAAYTLLQPSSRVPASCAGTRPT